MGYIYILYINEMHFDYLIQKIASLKPLLTVYFLFQRSIGMEDAESMNKFVEFNDSILLFIKKIENLKWKGTS